MELLSDEISSRIGTIVIVVSDGGLCALDFADCRTRMRSLLRARFGSNVKLVRRHDPFGYSSRIRAYMNGELDALDDIEIDAGGTAFQRKVWAALRKIPCGKTASYTDIARRIGRPTAARAVGMANSRNPVALIVPCHRVIGADGRLTGYAGGTNRKQWLLEHEGAV